MLRNRSRGSAWAAQTARALLGDQANRYRHVLAVADRAATTGRTIRLSPEMHELLVAAAYLHDVGYAPALAASGFHPLDGARHVAQAARDAQLASLVAHHSCAVVEARLRGLEDQLLAEFPPPEPLLVDALTHADMTVGPNGRAITIQDRLDDVRRRYGNDHIVTRAVAEAGPQLQAAVERTDDRLRRAREVQRRTA